MDLKSWKRFKRSGSYKRKVKSKLQQSRFILDNNEPENNNHNQVSIENLKVGSVHTEKNIESEPCVSVKDDSFVNLDDNLEESDSDVTSDEEKDKNYDFKEDIKKWAIQFNIPHNSLKSLLEILNKRLPYVLPTDPRTLLKTNTKIEIKPMGTGHYWHNSLKASLIEYFKNVDEIPQKLSLNINVDGLPISKSSKSQFWPILCNVHEISQLPPIIIGIYSGYGKVGCYINDFIGKVS